jgi:hypothetical protein
MQRFSECPGAEHGRLHYSWSARFRRPTIEKMPTADNSQTARLQRRKGQTLAAFHAAFPNARSLTMQAESMLLAQRLGTLTYYLQPGEEPLIEAGCCGVSPGGAILLSCLSDVSGTLPDGTTSATFTNLDASAHTLNILWPPKNTILVEISGGATETVAIPAGATDITYTLTDCTACTELAINIDCADPSSGTVPARIDGCPNTVKFYNGNTTTQATVSVLDNGSSTTLDIPVLPFSSSPHTYPIGGGTWEVQPCGS